MGFRFEKLDVLIVEDTAPMRKLLTSVLENLGIRNILTAADGQKAFEVFQKNNSDIILTDWLMDPWSGIDLTREIRKNPLSPNRMVPIVLITGYSAWDRVEEARDTGVTEFLVKPFTANDLARRIAHVINSPRDFIETQDFFGPDRRRRHNPSYRGPFRREDDSRRMNNPDDILLR